LIDRLTWVHLSDFHFTASGDPFSQTVACDALLTDLETVAKDKGPISFVAVTGDIAFSGQPAEYARASLFLGKLSEQLSVQPSRCFFVPGNDDVDRNAHAFARIGALQVLTSQQEVDRTLGSSAQLVDLIDRQAAYRAFLTSFSTTQDRIQTPDGLGYTVNFQIEPLRLAVLGLNSAWLCGADHEATSLIIGERQIIEAVKLARDCDPHLVIALVHHPIEWLTDWEQHSCRTSLLSAANFLHRGHMHQPDVYVSPHRPCLVIAAGSAHAGRFYPNSYNIVTLDLGAGISTVYPRMYRPEARAFEAAAPLESPCALGGEIPGTPQDLSEAMVAAAPSVADFAGYMTDLLLGLKDEIPLRVEGAIEFVPASIAPASDPAQTAAAVAFLRLRNLLRLHDPRLPLSAGIAQHTPLVEAYGSQLRDYASGDGSCRARITKAQSISSAEDGAPLTSMPHTALLLFELAARQDWQLLQSQARRAITSRDERLVRVARRALAQALMHSDELTDRAEAVELGEQLVTDPDATVDDYLIMCGASEVAGFTERSTQLVIEALTRWPASESLIAYARGLVTRTADSNLRSVLDVSQLRSAKQ